MRTIYTTAFILFSLLASLGSITYFFPASGALVQPFDSADRTEECQAAIQKEGHSEFPNRTFPIVETYAADIPEGLIGVNEDSPVDDPYDNVFHVALSEAPTTGSRVSLVYELSGVQDHTAVARSINGRQSAGGYIVAIDEEWRPQKERISAGWLQKGDNVIRFSLPEGATYSYKIRALQLMVEKESSTAQIREIIINQPSLNYYDHSAYLKGFLSGPEASQAQLSIDGQAVEVVRGEYECLLQRPYHAGAQWEVCLQAHFPDGAVVEKTVTFKKARREACFFPFTQKGAGIAQAFTPENEGTISFSGLRLSLPAKALEEEKHITLTGLRAIDLSALDQDLVNVTGAFKGYRLLPHGTVFKKAADIQIAYDPALIPEGYTAQDIRAFYFDEQARRWMALPKDSLCTAQSALISKTTHFTDFIAGIIKVPEAPETQAYTPTSIKDIKAADPSSGIVVIDPSQANSKGVASANFPLKLPAGRKGMQPQLAIQYNSEGGNGWLGLGWDLPIPFVGIDTRWGAPRFHPSLETETYTLSGGQLYPVAHRGDLVARMGDKEFHQRIEGAFYRIIRHGNSPKNYWWEVVNKEGTRSLYGNQPNSVLKDQDGNIAHWALTEVRDLNDNFIRYDYAVAIDAGVPNGTVPGQQLYIETIRYTGHGTEEGNYTVRFFRDDSNSPRRADVQINGRLGFKQVTASLLRRIVIAFNDKPIRFYELLYREGAFYKTLLASIIEKDQQEAEFYRHDFEYYDEVRQGGSYVPYRPLENWIVPSDNLDNSPSLFGASTSSSSGGTFAVTFGLAFGDFSSKGWTFGGHVTSSDSESTGQIAQVDIDGDGLPDKVFRSGDKLFYCKNLFSETNGNLEFGSRQPIISDVNVFSVTDNSSFGGGLEAHPFPGFVGTTATETESITSTYFSDFNGDGLIDIAHNRKVYFNHINADGFPEFTLNSNDTPSYIVDGAPVDPNIITIDPLEFENLVDRFPLHDVVRMWQAPYDGVINISSSVRLLAGNVLFGGEDGVRVAIQHNGIELISHTLAVNSTQVMNYPNLQVQEGDRLYFRVQSVFNGYNDQVQWDPEINYTNISMTAIDANNKKVGQFKASEDFLLSATQYITAFENGTIQVKGNFTKPVTSDDVQVLVQRIRGANTLAVIDTTFGWSTSVTDLPITGEIDVAADDQLIFQVFASTNVDWPAISWMPQFQYSAAPGNPAIIGQAFCPMVNYSMFNKVVRRTETWMPGNAGTVTVHPNITAPPTATGQITLSVKGVNRLYNKATFDINNAPANLTAQVPAGSPVYIEYHIPDRALADQLTIGPTAISLNGMAQPSVNAGVFTSILDEERLFGHLHRGWGQFVYNGNRGRATLAINQNELVFDSATIAQSLDILNGGPAPEDLSDLYNPIYAPFIIMLPDVKAGGWRGYDNRTYIRRDTMSSSRLGPDNIRQDYAELIGTNAAAPVKIANSSVSSFAAGVAIASGGGSSNDLNNMLDAVDLNGDRYPDAVAEKKIQYTNARGGLEPLSAAYSLKGHRTTGESSGGTVGGSFVLSKATNTGNTSGQGAYRVSTSLSSMIDKLGNNANEGPLSAIGSISASASFNSGEDETAHTWLDINGDGLPDKVYKNDTVALNLGYRFAPKELWNYQVVRSGESEDFGLGGGYNHGNMSWAGGVSYNETENKATRSLQDVNGDGLLDVLIAGNPMRVRINTGNAFGPEIPWPGADVLDEGASTASSVNFAFTWCVYVFPIFRACFNPQVFVGSGASRQSSQISDIDGDGYPDVLYSNNDGDLSARRSTIGRTNLLKKVSRPLHGAFSLDYALEGNTYEMQNARWVLTSVEVEDGLEGDGASRLKNTFEYEGGFYNRHEREFYGFRTVKTYQLDTENNDQLYRSTIVTYDNSSFYRQGLVLQTVLQDTVGRKFTEERNRYELKDITLGATLPPAFDNIDYAAAFPALVETEKQFYEGQPDPGLKTKMSYEYDVSGNIIAYGDFGDGTPEDRITAQVAYHDDDQKYIKSIPSSLEAFTSTGLIRKRQTTIDPAGNITQIRQYLEDGSSANHDMEYDGYGNLKKITRPLNHRNERLHFEFTYDDVVHTYMVQVRDGYGYRSESVYDLAFGQLLETRDMNKQKMVYTLDAKGRISTITGPYELVAGKPYTIAFDYHPDADMPFAQTRHYDPEHDSDIETFTFMDGLLRPVQVKKTASFFAGDGQDDEPGMIVSGRLWFDAFGRTTESYYPIREAAGNATLFNPAFNDINSTRMAYDILDRQLSATLPDGSETQMKYEIGNDNFGNPNFKSSTTDALGNLKESYADVRGRTCATNAIVQNGDIWTNFRYNPVFELMQVIDDGDNITTYTYDLLGRKLSVAHPDAGLTEFRYDLAGNLTEKITAGLRETIPNGGAIKYTYDKERLIGIDYPKNFQNKVQFHYGDSTATHNRVGRIWLQEDASGGQEFFYGPLGEVEKNIRTLLISEANVVTYVSQYEYDTWNRIKRISYPDGERVTYFYNRAGKLHHLAGEKQGKPYDYVDQMGYDEFEQRVFLKYGNGTSTHYQYEPGRRRLSAMQVANAAGRTFMDNTYAYDPMSNILSIRNTGPALHLQLGGPAEYNFVYDALYRLSEADGRWQGFNRRDSFSLSLEYDNLHNINRKNQMHWRDTVLQGATTYDNIYEYEGGQPHAPSRIGGRLYAYDANGNQLGWRGENFPGNRQIIWDEENRIMGVSDEGYISRYTYDASGERAIKSHGGVQGVFINAAPAGVVNHRDNYTAYVSPYLVAREHSFAKHYYVEGQRIASKLGTGKFNNKFWFQGGISAGKRDYGRRIHELQQAANALYRSLGNAPGPPTLPDYYAQPEIAGNPFPPFELDSAYYLAPAGWPQPPVVPVPGTAPGAPTLPYTSSVTNDNVQAGYGFYGDGQFNVEGNQFFYHPDHLGSTSYITDINGQVRQHLEYLPFGETFVDEHTNSDVQPYLYNAKPLDAETGLYYYGARFYDPKISVWMSVDPMAEKYAGWSPYNYVLLNPVNAIDPDGNDVILLKAPKGAMGFGHAAMLVGNEIDGWRYYSKEGTNAILGAYGSSNKSNDYERGEKVYETLEKFAQEINVIDNKAGHPRYTEAYRIKADANSDTKMDAVAKKSVKSWYGVIGNSCIDVLSNALNAGGFNDGSIEYKDETGTMQNTSPPGPNVRFDIIKRNNKGEDVTKFILPKN